MLTKSDVIEFFGSASALASKLGITKQAVSLWGEAIPEGRAWQIESITRGKLKASQMKIKKWGKPAA